MLQLTGNSWQKFWVLWLWYAANSWERFTRIALTAIALASLTLAISLLIERPAAPSDLLSDFGTHFAAGFRVADFAYVMTIVTSLVAATCIGFLGLTLRSSTRDGAANGQGHSSIPLGLGIALIASLLATLSFAIIYSSGERSTLSELGPLGSHLLVAAFLQFAISIGIACIAMLQHISDQLQDLSTLVFIGMAAFFSVPIACIGLFLVSSKTLGSDTMGIYCLLLFFLVAQAMYPHGWHRYYWPSGYTRALALYWKAGYLCWLLALFCAFGAILVDLSVAGTARQWYGISTVVMFVFVGLALALYQISVEGLRKYTRASFEDGSLVLPTLKHQDSR
jgi:hypothetical protein